LRTDVAERGSCVELLHQPEAKRHGGIDVRAAHFPDLRQRDRSTDTTKQETGDHAPRHDAGRKALHRAASAEHEDDNREAAEHEQRRPNRLGEIQLPPMLP
jgi:hypothetical protein